MAESTIRNLWIGAAVFMVVITGFSSAFFMIYKDQPQSITLKEIRDFNDSFNKQQELSASVDSIRTNIQQSNSTNFGAFGIIDSLVGTSWQSIKNLFSSLSFMSTILDHLTDYFGVPGWIPALLIVMMLSVVGFAIYRLVFQGEV